MPDYAREFVDPNFPDVLQACLLLERSYLRDAPNIAARIRMARIEFVNDLESLSRRYAQIATAEVKRVLASDPVSVKRGTSRRRVRGGQGIRSHIVSRPLPGIPGAVGVGDIEELQKAVDPDYPHDGSYWKVQEAGYSGHVGRAVRGYFFQAPGGTGYAASQDRRRVDAFFTPSKGPQMRIQNPIPPKWYLRDGSLRAGQRWLAEYERLQQRFITKLEAAVVGRPGTRRPKPGVIPTTRGLPRRPPTTGR